MALRVEVGLGPGHTVLDWDPAHLPKKEADTPIFGPYLLGVAKRSSVSATAELLCIIVRVYEGHQNLYYWKH